MLKLVVHSRAARYIERMDARIKAQLVAKLEQLAKNPTTMSGIKPMAGEWRGSIGSAMEICESSIFMTAPIKRSLSPMSVRAGMHTNDHYAVVLEFLDGPRNSP
jgi:hypothetical protein